MTSCQLISHIHLSHLIDLTHFMQYRGFTHSFSFHRALKIHLFQKINISGCVWNWTMKLNDVDCKKYFVWEEDERVRPLSSCRHTANYNRTSAANQRNVDLLSKCLRKRCLHNDIQRGDRICFPTLNNKRVRWTAMLWNTEDKVKRISLHLECYLKRYYPKLYNDTIKPLLLV